MAIGIVDEVEAFAAELIKAVWDAGHPPPAALAAHPWSVPPDVALLPRWCEDHRHRLGVDRRDNGARLGGEEATVIGIHLEVPNVVTVLERSRPVWVLIRIAGAMIAP